ncbi:PE family protein [Mycobacterium sp. ML4]
MAAVIAAPDLIAAATTDLAAIQSALSAAIPVQKVLPAAADEVSASIAHLFSQHGRDYLAASSQAEAYHEHFAQRLSAAANSYATAETHNAAVLVPLTAATAIVAPDQIFASLISGVTELFWQSLAYLYYLGFLLLIPIYIALAAWLPLAFLGSLFGLT